MTDEITEHTFYSPFGHVDTFTGTKAEYEAHFADLMEKRKTADLGVYDLMEAYDEESIK